MAYEIKCLKKSLLGVSTAYLIFGIIVLIIGCVFLVGSVKEGFEIVDDKYDQTKMENDVGHLITIDLAIAGKFLAGVHLAIVGGFVIGFAIMALVGTCKQNVCVLKMVAACLILSGIIQVILSGIALKNSSSVDENAVATFNAIIDANSADTDAAPALQFISDKYKCCMRRCFGQDDTCGKAIARRLYSDTSFRAAFVLVGGFINIGVSVLIIFLVKAINESRTPKINNLMNQGQPML